MKVFLLAGGARYTMIMRDYNTQIGANIKAYRKLQHLTQQDLADKLHKSLACISKYEKGSVSLDVYTLHEIAAVLGIPLHLLLPKTEEPDASEQAIQKLPDFFRQPLIYAYCIRSNRNEIVSMAIDVQPSPLQTTIYCDLRDPSDYRSFRYIMFGTTVCSDLTVQIYCSNPLLNGDFLLIGCNKHALTCDNHVCFSTTLSPTFYYRTSKIYLSQSPVSNPASLLPLLTISKEEILALKKTGYLSFY